MISRQASFFLGIFLLCSCVLMLQIIETRIISVISQYYLAFFGVSMAMFGMTFGALIVYYNQDFFSQERLFDNSICLSSIFGLSILFSTAILITSVLLTASNGLILSIVQWLKMIAALLPPYIFAGMAISIALTKSPWRPGLVYGADLLGAAFGCLGAIALMSAVDAVSALLLVAALACLASWAFALGCGKDDISAKARHLWPRLLRRPRLLTFILFFFALGNAAIFPRGLDLSFSKEHIEIPQDAAHIEWNPYSRIRVEEPAHTHPKMWAASPSMPPIEVDERAMSIDGGAATPMYRFSGDLNEIGFLKYDLTNLAYYIRDKGRAAVIGVGGGRDMLAAYLFGFRDVTGVEINSIFIDLLTRRFRDFNHLPDLPGVRFEVDEARSWFARKGLHNQFDLVQMSLSDTWAATSVGSFSLSENGLYTVQGWKYFLNSLAPDGVFTVSRWYSPTNASETGRLLSLAKASLGAIGIAKPQLHMFLASLNNLATLIVSRSPLSQAEIAKLREASGRLGFSVLISPDMEPNIASLSEIMNAANPAELEILSSKWHLDVTAPTDDRPFFFNQLRIADPVAMINASNSPRGVNQGNLWATFTLMTIVFLSLIFVVLTIIVPAFPSGRYAGSRLVALGTVYFTFIGLGFMLVEISLIQRLSLFLGHPIYGLAIGLFAIIFATGVGSFISEWIKLSTTFRFAAWSAVLVLDLAALPSLLPALEQFESLTLAVRACVAVALTVPLGILMGFAFPSGLRLVNRIHRAPAPWFWAINGSAGVLGSGIALEVNIAFSINVGIWLAAFCYFAAGLSALPLLMPSTQRPATARFQTASEAASGAEI